MMNADLAYLVGALRDGSVYYYKRNRSYYTLFYQKEKSWLINSIGKRISHLFNVHYTIDEYKKEHYRLRISNKCIYELFRFEFCFPEEGEGQQHRLIPDKIKKGNI